MFISRFSELWQQSRFDWVAVKCKVLKAGHGWQSLCDMIIAYLLKIQVLKTIDQLLKDWDYDHNSDQKVLKSCFFLQVLKSLMQKQRSWWLLRRLYNILQTRKMFMNNLFQCFIIKASICICSPVLFVRFFNPCNFILQKATPTGSTCITERFSLLITAASLASISPVQLYLNVLWELKDNVNPICFSASACGYNFSLSSINTWKKSWQQRAFDYNKTL